MRKIIFPVLIFLLAFLLRFYYLDKLPPGLGRDEVSVAYNAYSILKTGRDEHGRFLPVYFEAIGDQKLPVIIYISIPSVAAFGLTEIGARFPFALLGSLTIVFLYLLLKKAHSLNKNFLPQSVIYIAPLLLAINPWHIAHSRAVYEICLGTFFFTVATYTFLQGLTNKKWFVISVIFFILAFYTYSLTRLLAPLLFLYFSWVYRSDIFQFPKKYKLSILLFICISLIPFFITFFEPGGITAPSGAVIFSSSKVRSSIMEFRSYVLQSDARFLGALFFNRIIMTLYEYGKNMLAAISPEFFFAKGSDMAGIGTQGQFYIIEFLPFIIGLIYGVKHALSGNRFSRLLLGWIVLTLLSASFTIGAPYATRTLFLVVPFIILIALGWLQIVRSIKRDGVRKVAILVITGVYFWHMTFYFISYYFRFPIVYAQNWEAKNKELFQYLKNEENNTDTIIITKPELSMYAFLLFYHQIAPEEVWTKLTRHGADPDGWKHGKKLGKYEFRGIDWVKDLSDSKNIILVSQGGEYPEKQEVTREILYPEKYTVFPYGQQVIAYPEKRVAFRIWKFVYNPQTMQFDLMKE